MIYKCKLFQSPLWGRYHTLILQRIRVTVSVVMWHAQGHTGDEWQNLEYDPVFLSLESMLIPLYHNVLIGCAGKWYHRKWKHIHIVYGSPNTLSLEEKKIRCQNHRKNKRFWRLTWITGWIRLWTLLFWRTAVHHSMTEGDAQVWPCHLGKEVKEDATKQL